MPGKKPFDDVNPEHVAAPRRPLNVRELRAFAHPLRLRILDLLGEHGAMTASQISALVDESPANCAWHLRTLAKYGFVEEADPGRSGRARPWKAVPVGVQLTADADGPVDPDAVSAARAALRAMRARDEAAADRWDDTRGDATGEWQEAAFEFSFRGRITAAELRELRRTWDEVTLRLMGRPDDQAPTGAAMVVVQGRGFPTSVPTRSGQPAQPAQPRRRQR